VCERTWASFSGVGEVLCMCACMYPCVTCDQVSFFLVSWSAICTQDGCYHGLVKGALPEEYLKVTILTSTAWENTRLIWCLSYPSGGHHWSLGATFLGRSGDWLLWLVSLRIHASPPTLWSVLPCCWGSAWVCRKLGDALVLRSGTGSWVLSG